MMLEELWMPILTTKNNFVSTNGQIGSLRRERFSRKLKFNKLKIHNYNNKLAVNLNLNNKGFKPISVARLVAMTFIENPNEYNSVGHKDGDYTNNKVNNLFWKKTNKEKYESSRNVSSFS